VAEEAARAGNRRDFMVALPERVGDAAADVEQQVAPEVQKLFNTNPDAIKNGWGKVCNAPDEFWDHADAYAYPGMEQAENRLMHLFEHAAKPLSLSMQRKEQTYANILHRGYSLLAQRGAAAGPADDLYCALRTCFTSLEEGDGGWAGVLEPDETGFKGFTSYAPTSLSAWKAYCWKECGFAFGGGEVTDSPVVCVKSAPADGRGLHTAVKLGYAFPVDRYMLPPLTLFKVVGDQPSFRMRSSDDELELAATEGGAGGGGGARDGTDGKAAERRAVIVRKMLKCAGCGALCGDTAAFQAHCEEVEHGDDFASECEEVEMEVEMEVETEAARFVFRQPSWSPALQRSLGWQNEGDGVGVVAATPGTATAGSVRAWLDTAGGAAVRGKVVLLEASRGGSGGGGAGEATAVQAAAALLAAAGAAAAVFADPPPADVVLGGSSEHHAHLLGKYTLQEGQESGGPPVYRKAGEEGLHLCFFGKQWRVSAKANVGTNAGFMRVADTALHPGRIEGEWAEYTGSEWVPAPEVWVEGGAPPAPAAATAAAAVTKIPVLFVSAAAAAQLRGAAAAGSARLRWPTIIVQQQLITVQPTYLLTRADEGGGDGGTGKMCSRPTALSYGGRADFGRGHVEITRDPVLTMEQEFQRDDKWTDWDGTVYSAVAEWAYVAPGGAAREGGPDGRQAKRDAGNDGKTADDFFVAANARIRQKLQQRRQQAAAASGRGPLLEEEDKALLLVLEEVLAIRLYSGPAYVPLNTFLREVAKLSTDWRSKLARDPKTTYSATVGWLISGIRKLARVTELGTLYRGVKGQLPEAFAVPDVQGMISATDFGFMSTSRKKGVTLGFMSKTQPNVLWELACREEDEAYHNGADIAVISQFPGEEEVLFPPLTMMVAAGPQEELVMVDEVDEAGTQFKRIGVVPYHI
jgi:hypothetical protein